jgi:hypothetical protein
MTAWVLAGTGDDIGAAFRALGKVLVATGPNPYAAPFVVFLNAVLISVIALVVWLELVMREAAVYVALAYLPLTLAAMVWERTVHWSRRLSEWLLAIILAKFTIACAFALAASAITGGFGDGGGVTTVLAGSATLLIAAITPWALLRIIPFAESAAGNLTRGHVTSAATGAPGVQSATSVARQMLLMRFTSGMGGSQRAASVASSPTPKPTMPTGGASDPGGSLPRLPDKQPVKPRAGGAR